jgi:hypothetical protein
MYRLIMWTAKGLLLTALKVGIDANLTLKGLELPLVQMTALPPSAEVTPLTDVSEELIV